jgi:hypothetical protein
LVVVIHISFQVSLLSGSFPSPNTNNNTKGTSRFVLESLVTVQIITPALPRPAILSPYLCQQFVLPALLTSGF